jgi:hypothetical protein
MLVRITILLTLGLGLTFVACGGDNDDEETPTETQAAVATATEPAATPLSETPSIQPTGDISGVELSAIDALATWLGPVADPSAITVVSVEAMTWPDGCLGLALSNEVCTDALVEGYLVELGLGDATYLVRIDATGAAARWEANTEILVNFESAVTNLATFTTDDGNTLEAQLVFGTEYGVELSSLSTGDPVGIGLADAPQRGGFLLVYADAAGQAAE